MWDSWWVNWNIKVIGYEFLSFVDDGLLQPDRASRERVERDERVGGSGLHSLRGLRRLVADAESSIRELHQAVRLALWLWGAMICWWSWAAFRRRWVNSRRRWRTARMCGSWPITSRRYCGIATRRLTPTSRRWSRKSISVHRSWVSRPRTWRRCLRSGTTCSSTEPSCWRAKRS